MTSARLDPGPHLDLLLEALDAEAGAQRALLAGDHATARPMFEAAARRYRASWELAPPASYGRLVGMIKAATIAGEPEEAAAYLLGELRGVELGPTSGYALAIGALTVGDDQLALTGARAMRDGDAAFGRAAAAVEALVAGDSDGYCAAIRSIITDFAGRSEHLTGVPIADTAVMLEIIAERRGMACRPVSPLMPGS